MVASALYAHPDRQMFKNSLDTALPRQQAINF
jgi:hypothetical protein